VPNGEEWQHEIKFDGFRVQIHKLGNEVETLQPQRVSIQQALPAALHRRGGEVRLIALRTLVGCS
jgi:ATP-dependent DNA ligase